MTSSRTCAEISAIQNAPNVTAALELLFAFVNCAAKNRDEKASALAAFEVAVQGRVAADKRFCADVLSKIHSSAQVIKSAPSVDRWLQGGRLDAGGLA